MKSTFSRTKGYYFKSCFLSILFFQKEKKRESEKEAKAKENIKKHDEELKEVRKENWYTDIPG